MSPEQTPEFNEPPLEFKYDQEVMYIHSLGHYWLTNEEGKGGSSSYVVNCRPAEATVYEKTIVDSNGSTKKTEYLCVFDDIEPNTRLLKRCKSLGKYTVMRIEGIASGKRVFDQSAFFGDEPPTMDDQTVHSFIEAANQVVLNRMHTDFEQHKEAA